MSESNADWGGIVGVGVMALIAYFGYRYFTTPSQPTLEQQRTCAEQSAKFFEQGGYSAVTNASYTDRFNVADGRCFVLVSTATVSGAPHFWTMTEDSLFDAFSHELLGSLTISDSSNPQAPAVTCIIMDGTKTRCNSHTDWEKWSDAYMQPLNR